MVVQLVHQQQLLVEQAQQLQLMDLQQHLLVVVVVARVILHQVEPVELVEVELVLVMEELVLQEQPILVEVEVVVEMKVLLLFLVALAVQV
tara:strand:+ start:203 stop:475 length:273 start_codon:yes stop_codon:yes gene_type:complete